MMIRRCYLSLGRNYSDWSIFAIESMGLKYENKYLVLATGNNTVNIKNCLTLAKVTKSSQNVDFIK